MSFTNQTMQPGGTSIAGWNADTFAPQFQIDPVANQIITPNTQNWASLGIIPAVQLLIAAIIGHAFEFYAGEIPATLFAIDDNGTPRCAYGRTGIYGGLTLEQCAWPEAEVLGGIVIGQCGSAFNAGVFPPPAPPPPPPPERCPELPACAIIPNLTFLQEVNE